MTAKFHSPYVLMSYFYIRDNQQVIDGLARMKVELGCELLVDSGAHSVFHHPTQSVITLDSYNSFLHKNKQLFDRYINLDVIANRSASVRNYEWLREQGHNPMFVLTQHDNDFNYLRSVVNDYPHICIAGGRTSKGNWMIQRVQRVAKETNGVAQQHGLGYVISPEMYQMPLYSVDSSSWVASQRYGVMHVFDFKSGKLQLAHTTRMPKHFAEPFQRAFDRYAITRKMLQDPANFRGAYSISSLLSLSAWFEYQIYSKLHGLKVFIVISNTDQLQYVPHLAENFYNKSYTYDNFRAWMLKRRGK